MQNEGLMASRMASEPEDRRKEISSMSHRVTPRVEYLFIACITAALASAGCKDAARMANEAMSSANEALAKTAAHEYMASYMGQDYGSCYDMSTPERQKELERKARKMLKVVKPRSARKELKRAGGREMVAGVLKAAKEAEEYPRMSDFTIEKDSWSFNEVVAEVIVTIDEMQEDRSKTSRKMKLTLKDVGDAWLVNKTEDVE